jgi:cytidylate kinase
VNRMAIAIDGPSASGKSTVARRVAAALGWLYVDSGAVYRGVTWQALRCGVKTDDGEALAAMMDAMGLEFFVGGGAVRFSVEGIEPVAELRTPEIVRHVSFVAAQPQVRARVVAWLQGMTRLGRVVMEGRDIGTVVFPDAAARFYLDASPDERARRRHAEAAPVPGVATVADVANSLGLRDRMDRTRRTAPLKVAEGAEVIDSTGMTIEQVVARILERARQLGLAPAAGAARCGEGTDHG